MGIVLNWNNYEDTRECLQSLKQLEFKGLDIVVVDNNSTDGSYKKINQNFPEIDIYQTTENRGFAGGMNLGINKALDLDFDYIWILNNDVVFQDRFVLNKLVKTLESSPDVGGVTPRIREAKEGSTWFLSGEINWDTATANHTEDITEEMESTITNQYIPLCCTLFRNSVFKDIGLLSEKYFMYYEDLEFGVRATKHGYKLITDTNTSVIHNQGGTAGDQFSQVYSYYKPRNAILFAREFNQNMTWMSVAYMTSWILEELGFRIWKQHSIIPFILGIADGLLNKYGRGRYPK